MKTGIAAKKARAGRVTARIIAPPDTPVKQR